jgi:predicted MFS family arabinose efflux permease
MTSIGARSAVLVAICAFGTAALLVPLSMSAMPLTLLVLALWASGTWFGVPALQAVEAAHAQRLRFTPLAFGANALGLAGVFCPALVGTIIAEAGLAAAYWSAAFIALAAFVLARTVLPRPSRLELTRPPKAALAA